MAREVASSVTRRRQWEQQEVGDPPSIEDAPPVDPAVRASEDQYAKAKDREGDQPMPVPNDRRVAHDLLIEYVQSRLDLGIHRYGTGLQPFNGRDSITDSIEEGVDLLVYLITLREERAELRALMDELRPMVGMSIRGNEIIDRLSSYFEGKAT